MASAGGGVVLPQTRPASAGGLGRRGFSANRYHRPVTASSIDRRTAADAAGADEDETTMKVPPLASIPISLATQLEKQFAGALGLSGHRHIPRLAADVEKENALCNGGGWCLARWFARASLEQVHGSSLAHLSGIPEMIGMVREELAGLRKDRKSIAMERERAERDAALLASLQGSYAAAEKELVELRAVKGEVSRAIAENGDLKIEVGRLVANKRALEREVAQLQTSHRELLESEIAQSRDSAEEAKKELEKQLSVKALSEDTLSRQLKEAKTEIESSRLLNSRLQRQLAECPKRGNNRSRGAGRRGVSVGGSPGARKVAAKTAKALVGGEAHNAPSGRPHALTT